MGTYLSQVRKSLFTLILIASPALAQTGLGVVTGRVSDPSKASVGNSDVLLTDTQRGEVRTAHSNDTGLYYFGSLPIGSYHLKVSAAGFTAWETDFKVEAGQTMTVDPALIVGAVQSTIDVTNAASLVETEGSDLSDVKTARDIHDLPLNGRFITNLFTLTAGVEAGQNANPQFLTPRTNGMPTGSTQILLDGQSYRDTFGGGISRVQPGLDSIQEYRIETSGSDATLDNPATVELVTRGGTNEFHGGAFETLRNNYIGVAKQVQDAYSGYTTPKLIRNEFGGFVGGPIKKNKTFFFYDQELLKQRQEVTANTSVPTAANWAGDFSAKIDAATGTPFTIYNPFTTTASGSRQPFPGNKIPTSMIDAPLVNALEAVTPKPSPAFANVNPWVGSNFYTTYPLNTDTDSITVRGDQIFSVRDSLSLRMTRSVSDYLQTGGHYGYPAPGVTNATGTSAQNSDIWNATAHYTHTFSPALLNDLQLGGMISMNHQGTNSDSVQWTDKLGLPNPFGATGWPTVALGYYNFNTEYDPFEGGAWDNDNRKYQNLTQYQAEDNLSWVRGRHTLKFGVKFRAEFNNVTEAQQAQGSDVFDLQWTGLYNSGTGVAPFTGSDLASLELGIPYYLSNQYNHGFFYFRQQEYAGYGQDTWRVRPNLSITAGLRYEFWTPYHEKYDRMENLDLNQVLSNPNSMQVIFPGNTSINNPALAPAAVIQSWEARGLTGVSANSVHFPSALFPNVWNDVAPRIAVAYSPGKDWSIRAGYGIYYYPLPLAQILQSLRSNAPLNLRFTNIVGENNVGNTAYSLLNSPTQADQLSGVGGTASVAASAAPGGPQGFLAFDPNGWNDNRIQEWTFAVERQFWKDFVVRLAYTGNHGSNLEQNWDYNAPLSQYNYQLQNGIQPSGSTILNSPSLRQVNPNWTLTGADGVVRHNGYSNSNSFQASVQKRLSHGLSFSFFYAHTHDLATNDPDGFSNTGSSGINAESNGGAISPSVPSDGEILGDPNLSDSQRLRLVYTNSGQVPPQRMTWSGVWQLPFGRGNKFLSNTNRVVDAVAGGWQIAFIGTWEGGFWMGNDPSLGQFGNPALSSSQRLHLSLQGVPELLWFRGFLDPTSSGITNVNLSALQALEPANLSQQLLHPRGADLGNDIPLTVNGVTTNVYLGDMLSPNARNYMLGPGGWNQDLTLFKYFAFSERIRLRLSGDFFNSLNHVNLNNPNSRTGLIDLTTQPNAARTVQLGARLEF